MIFNIAKLFRLHFLREIIFILSQLFFIKLLQYVWHF